MRDCRGGRDELEWAKDTTQLGEQRRQFPETEKR